ncbi:MAG: hypothetical protein WAN74_07135, partial [Thermoplasmata archaeon]
GLVILRMEEPAPKPELIQKSTQGRLIAEIPLHLVVEAAPWDSRPGRVGLRTRGTPRSSINA